MEPGGRPSGRERQEGFTLVEALIAIVVLVFGLIAVTNLLLVASTSTTVANASSAATDVAAGIVEELKGQPFDDADLAAGNYNRDTNVPGVGLVQSNWTITDLDARTKFIRVRAEGLGALTRARSRAEFTTIRSCTTPELGCPSL
jgi:Tfp pilus assembly protein PilV